MDINCKNCGHPTEGNFCAQCGQSVHTHRINFHFLWHDFQHAMFHFDNGIFFTIKELFTRPGHTIRAFIEGKRVKHFKPFALIITLAAVHTLLFHYLGKDPLASLDDYGNNTSMMEKANGIREWINTHYAIITLVTIPIFAFSSYIAFIKQGYNFAEHLVLNAFITGQKLIVGTLGIFLFQIFQSKGQILILIGVLYSTSFLLQTWTYMQYFNKVPKWKSLLLSFAAMLIYLIIMFGVNKLLEVLIA